VESKEFFQKIKEQYKKDEYWWNLAQENPCVYISPQQEDVIMERMFLVNTIERLEKEIEQLQGRKDEVIMESGRRWTKLNRIKQILEEK
jgi:hypothetical protein